MHAPLRAGKPVGQHDEMANRHGIGSFANTDTTCPPAGPPWPSHGPPAGTLRGCIFSPSAMPALSDFVIRGSLLGALDAMGINLGWPEKWVATAKTSDAQSRSAGCSRTKS